MTQFQWRLVDTGWGTGHFNMDYDERLAAEVASGVHPTTLRFFQWRPYCISLGKHQKIEDINLRFCRDEGMDVAFRPTGGRAILHAEELTYSFVFRNEIEGSVEETYYQISTALIGGLRKLGIPAEMNDVRPDLKKWYQQRSSASCFASSTRYEVQVAGKKIIGSAQKRYAGATLQHGSILIGAYHRRLPEFLNLNDEQKERLRILMNEKTTELQAIRLVAIEELKRCLILSFSEVFQVSFGEERATEHVGSVSHA